MGDVRWLLPWQRWSRRLQEKRLPLQKGKDELSEPLLQPIGHKPAITFCYRGFAANWGTRHVVVSILEKAGHHVRQIKDGPLDLAADSVVWIWGNTN